jgi:hypothetical protein
MTNEIKKKNRYMKFSFHAKRREKKERDYCTQKNDDNTDEIRF